MSARGNEHKSILRDERDRRRFLELIGETVTRFQVRWHCFVLMDNHHHLLLELGRSKVDEASGPIVEL